MNEKKRMARLRITVEALRELMQLPACAEIIRLEAPRDFRGIMEIVIEGAGWPTAPGEAINTASPSVSRTINAAGDELRPVVHWGFPE
jgi:hypothetical protein